MRGTVRGVTLPAVLAIVLGGGQPARADPPEAKVQTAQEKGVEYLKGRQTEDGHWENDTLSLLQPGGTSALALLALLETGVKPDDRAVERGLKYLRTVEPRHTYVVSLQTQVLCIVNQKGDAALIGRNVKWLADAGVGKGKAFEGWTYEAGGASGADLSNTRFAVAALYAAHRAGFKVGREGLWEDIRALLVRTQLADGGWGYAPEGAKTKDAPFTIHPMTAAGLLCLALADAAIGKEDDAASGVRQYGEAWLADHFRLETPPATFYNLDALAALGRATGAKELGTKDKKHEWYRLGADWLLKNQRPGGSWQLRQAVDNFPVVSTSFALRFLASRPD
jgi:hypothetical protein